MRFQLIISIFVWLLVLSVSAANQFKNPTCEQQSCKPCFDSCPLFREQVTDLTSCKRKLLIASSQYASNAETECKFNKCADIQYERLCQIVWTPSKSTTAQKNKFLDDKVKDMKNRIKVLDGYGKGLYKSLPKARKDYDRKVQSKLELIKKNFNEALQVRKKFLEQKQNLRSVESRTIKLQLSKLQLESKQLLARAKYWKLKLYTLRSAIKSSPLRLKKARDNLRDDYRNILTNIELENGLRDKTLSRDQKAILLIGLRLRADKQVNDFKSLVANVRAQQVFIKEARGEIGKLLKKVKDDVTNQKSSIACGPWALSDLVTNALISSMPKFF